VCMNQLAMIQAPMLIVCKGDESPWKLLPARFVEIVGSGWYQIPTWMLGGWNATDATPEVLEKLTPNGRSIGGVPESKLTNMILTKIRASLARGVTFRGSRPMVHRWPADKIKGAITLWDLMARNVTAENQLLKHLMERGKVKK
jgi:hypothetical protein